jgi:rfaE bifunctional protein nucleotidyltransferase chain/domain
MNQAIRSTSKIVSQSEFSQLREEFREVGQKVIHCHGTFDLLHPGHIAHLEEAKSLGDVLVVSVTSAPYINKGPGHPFFSDELRMKSLAALGCVDFVVLSEAVTAEGVFDVIQPDLYVKGAEYKESSNDVTQNIDKEVDKVRSYGGDVHFTNGVVFSSTKLINKSFSVYPPDTTAYAKDISTKYSFEDIRNVVEDMKSLKILVVGDIIIDEYIFCNVQGLMSKDRAFSSRHIKEERYLGGSLAVARHLASFSDNVTVCGIMGDEPHIHTQILNDLSKDMHINLQFDNEFRTIVKSRFIERRGIREEYEKLFSINYLNDDSQNAIVNREIFYNNLNEIVSNFDMVVLTDFGHGLVDNTVMEILQEKVKFLALNCQTNSSNYGTNLITKYRRADAFALDERELTLAFAKNSKDKEKQLIQLKKHLQSKMGWLTLGSMGCMGIGKDYETKKNPALTLTVQDTVGAGDAFFALAVMCACIDAPLDIGSFLGSIAGAIASNILGNSRPVGKAEVLKYATSLLKF